ncbi:MAG: hypothetical protein ACRDTU_23175 [Micromonosporaceae bacterium]
MKRKGTGGLAVAGLALVTALAGCGGGGTDAGKDSGAEKSPTAGADLAIQPEGTGDPFVDARTAAAHMPMTATTLAGGYAKAAKLKGDVEAPASELRANLTALLQEHVYLAGIAVATAYAKGPDSAEFKAAAEVVNANATDLSEAVGSVGGEKAGKQFDEGFKAHIQDFVSYAVAAKGKDEAGKKEAVDNLTAYAKEQGKFWNAATKGALPASAVQKSFEHHIGGVAGAVDALAAGDTSAYEKLKHAAEHMPEMAATLAGGVAKATKMEGDVDSPASKLRSDLTALLQEHVYLAGIAVFTAYTTEGGTGSEAFKAAAKTLDDNSVALSKGIGSLAGPDNEKTFLKVWRDHIGNFVTYAEGAATKDDAKREKAIDDLDAYRGTAGDFFEKTSKGELPSDAVADSLKTHVAGLAGAIDSMAKALVK